jgi:hypothetical protein
VLVLSFFTFMRIIEGGRTTLLPFWSTVSPWSLRLTRPKWPLNTKKPSSAPSFQGPPP